MSEIHICIPAWGERARRLANTVTIPAVLAALGNIKHSYQFVIWTDEKYDFNAIAHKAEFRQAPREPENAHAALTEMHTRVLREAPIDTMVCLLNADTIPSQELFSFGQFVLSSRYRVVASFGMRTLWRSGMELPPIQTGRQLLEWGWQHKHPVVSNCIWGSGKTAFPVTLYFVNGHSNAVAHCSHLHPFLIRKDNRDFQFRGTIDDGLLHLYDDDEVFYPRNREIGFLELSDYNDVPEHFMRTTAEPLNEDMICEFGKNYLTTHCRNLRQCFRIAGEKPVYSTQANQIADRIVGNK